MAVAAGDELFVPLAGLVDFEKERGRVARELERAQADLEKLTRKLSNEGFLAKAAADVVEKDRARAAELGGTVAKLTAQLAELA
jgi:valyl-tRNA synthetase